MQSQHPFLFNHRDQIPLSVRVSDGEPRRQDVLAVLQQVAPQDWKPENLDTMRISQVSGGITNLLFRAENERGDAKLVRIYGQGTDMFVHREQENFIFAQLSQLGVAPKFFGHFLNGRVEESLPCRSLEPFEMKQSPYCEAIARATADFHAVDIEGLDREPKLFRKLETFFSLVEQVEFEKPEEKEMFATIDLQELRRECEWVKQQVERFAGEKRSSLPPITALLFDVVFTHNDLLSGNVLVRPDVADSVMLIDYEYSAYSYRGHDIGNHWCEMAGFDANFENDFPSHDVQARWAAAYLRQMNPTLEITDEGIQQFIDGVALFLLTSDFFWGLWAILQAKYSPISFDFLPYALRRFKGYWYHKRALPTFVDRS